MNLENIIYVSGKPDLYKIISQGSNMVVGESLIDKKRIPLYLNNQTRMLEDIGIYTYNETQPLSEIFRIIAEKEKYKETISHSVKNEELTRYFKEIVPEYDEERVYISDIKKVIKWYNMLHKSGHLKKQVKQENKN